MMVLLSVVVAVALGFAFYHQYYTKTAVEDAVPKRVWTALVAAASALGALVSSWFHTGATP